jgi:hypothetical protein
MYWYLKKGRRTKVGIETQRGTWGWDVRLIGPKSVNSIEYRNPTHVLDTGRRNALVIRRSVG